MSIGGSQSWKDLSVCPYCRGRLIRLESGGCGGWGSLKGCEKCDKMFMQDSGGIAATRGGETWRAYYCKLSEYRRNKDRNK